MSQNWIDNGFQDFLLETESEEILGEVDLFLLQMDEASREVSYKPSMARYIDPLTNKNWRAADKWRQLAAIVKQQRSQGVDTNRIWISFSNLPRIATRTKISDGKSTPVGIFGYPANYILERQGSVPNFSDRNYILVFKAKGRVGEVGAKFQYNYDTGENDPTDPNANKRFLQLKKRFNAMSENAFSSVMSGAQTKLLNTLEKWTRMGVPMGDYIGSYQRNYSPKRRRVQTDASDLIEKTREKLTKEYENARGNAVQKAKSLDLSFLSDTDSFNQGERDHTLARLGKRLEEADFYNEDGEYTKKFSNIDVKNMTLRFTPLYLKYLIRYTPEEKPPENMTSETDVPFEDVGKYDSDFQDGYYNYGRIWRDYQLLLQKTPDKSPMLATVMKMVQRVFKESIENYIKENSNQEALNYPMRGKLEAFADEKGLDFESIARTAMKESKSGMQFIYQVTKLFAQKIASDNPKTKWQMQWHIILRKLGLDHVVDTMDSSAIHSAEPTQGVFMNPTQIEQIAVITNTSHTDNLDPSGRPKQKDWNMPYDQVPGEHKRTGSPKNQQDRNSMDRSIFANKSGGDRTMLALQYRLSSMTNNIYYYAFSYPEQAEKTMDYMSIMMKSLIAARPKSSKSARKGVDAMLVRLITSLERMQPEMHGKVSNDIIYKVNRLMKLAYRAMEDPLPPKQQQKFNFG